MIDCTTNPVKLRIVRSDGEEFTMGYGTGWKIPSDGLENWANLSYTVDTSQNVLTDGSSLVGKRIDETDRTMKASYHGSDPIGDRGKALSFFNARFAFRAYLTYMGRERFAEGELYGFQLSSGNIAQPMELTFTLLCLNPFLMDPDGNDHALTDAQPMFGFPYVSHVRQQLPNGERKPVGSLASKLLFDEQNTIYNSGDVPCNFAAVIDFDGKVVNPTITKDGKHITVMREFAEGETLRIDFTAAPPTVTIDGENVISLCSRDSDFVGMEMQVGANVFTYSCENVANRLLMDVKILFNKQYLGI